MAMARPYPSREPAYATVDGAGAAAVLLTATPGAFAQSPTVDSVQVTGSAPGFPNIAVNAEQSGEGLNATGQAFLQPSVGAIMTGRVTGLRVTGPDRGAGTPDAPTTAVVEFFDIRFGPVTVKVVDNGGTATNSDTDLFARRSAPAASPRIRTCRRSSHSTATWWSSTRRLPPRRRRTSARTAAGRRSGALFGNQGQCVAFVQPGPKPQ
jgi:hypothetical protein